MRPAFSGSRQAALFGALLAALLPLGCNVAACDTADESNPPEIYRNGTVTDGEYESSPWKSGWLHFPGGKQYILEHHLGHTPKNYMVSLSFTQDGERSTQCSGNSCLELCITDDAIWLKNDTCAEFWIRVVTTGGRSATPGTCLKRGTRLLDGSAGGNGSIAGDAASDATGEILPHQTNDAGVPFEAASADDAGD
ncbi:MAG TPA: hypothetical protein VJT73_00275 [Polyangiaceae bacterium]|nr:hypothetical protein [Polyangiaceae bacterium]